MTTAQIKRMLKQMISDISNVDHEK